MNTEDGFMLEMHRVPYGRANNNTTNRPVVFLQHGLLSSSGEWVLMRPGKGLGEKIPINNHSDDGLTLAGLSTQINLHKCIVAARS